MGIRLWVDDLREPPDGWTWAKTSNEALWVLWQNSSIGKKFDEISFDHDLGGDDTTRPVVRWLCEHPDYWPEIVYVHTANPVGYEYLSSMIDRYGPGVST